MTPHSFREALDNLVWAASMLQGSTSPLLLSARAEVERLYAARVGEEMEVERLFLRYGEGHGICFAEDDDRFAPGDRVYVTKGEAG